MKYKLALVIMLLLVGLTACGEDETFSTDELAQELPLYLKPGEMAFLHITDTHGSDLTIDPAVYYLNASDCLFGLHTGDLMASSDTKRKLRNTEKPFLLIPGNHDAYTVYYGSTGQYGFRTSVLGYTKQDRYVTFGDNKANYWYTDFTKDGKTLRLIGIDQYEVNAIGQKSNDWNVFCVYSQHQIDWLTDLLSRSQDCDGVIIAIHNGFGNKTIGARSLSNTNAFTSILAVGFDNGYDYYGKGNTTLIPDIINAYQTGENLKDRRYLNSAVLMDTLTVTTHFSQPADNFIAYLGGHTHFDLAETLPYYPRQLQVLMTYCGKGTGSDYNDIVKSNSGRNSYNFNVNIINFEKRQLKLLRKGAKTKIDGTTRDSIIFNY